MPERKQTTAKEKKPAAAKNAPKAVVTKAAVAPAVKKTAKSSTAIKSPFLFCRCQ